MIYIFNNKKYTHEERDTKQTSLNIIKVEYQHLNNICVSPSNLAESHILFFVASGNVCLNDKKIEKGNVVYISKFTKFNFGTCESASIIQINFDYSKSIALFNEKIRILRVPIETQEYIEQIYNNRFFRSLLSGANEGLLLNILNILNNLCDFHMDELSLYQKCRGWIEQNAIYNITAESTAAAMNCTVAHLNRTMKKHSGKCLSTIINERKLFEIKRLIKTSNLSTEDIALKLNFGSAELLRKFFKYHNNGISLNVYKMNLKTETPICN